MKPNKPMTLTTTEQKRELLAELRQITRADESPRGEGKQAFFKNQLSPKQRRYVAYRLQGMSNPEAAKRAGYKSASGGLSVWKKMQTNQQIVAAFEAVGITPEEIARKTKELMSCNTWMRVSEGVAKEIPDNTNRNKALQLAVEVVGGFAPKHETITVQTFERKVEIIQKIKDNPELLDSLKRKLIEIKKTTGPSDDND